jgi:starch synthase
VTLPNLAHAIGRAKALFQDKPVWLRMQQNGMTVDVSWHNSARHYADLYRQVAKPD